MQTIAHSKIMRTFATAIEKDTLKERRKQGALVQLVRIHACHAWGHGFESRTHRSKHWKSMFYKLNTRLYTQDVKSGVFHQEAKRKGLNLLEFAPYLDFGINSSARY